MCECRDGLVDVASVCECEYANCGVAGRDLARVGGAGQTGAGCRVDTSLDTGTTIHGTGTRETTQ